jgi:histone H3/H4
MTLADSHVKALLKEGTGRAGTPPSGSEWRVAPEAIEAAKAKAEDYLRRLGEESAKRAGQAKRSTLKAEDVQEPGGSGGDEPAMVGSGGGALG